jgi:hypothetical protein
VIPKYWSLKTWFNTFPSSGRGVTESLALDQAPFTRMPGGTFVPVEVLLEKSPPFLALLGASGLPLWHQAGISANNTRMSREPKT